jgi:hypothetical protein
MSPKYAPVSITPDAKAALNLAKLETSAAVGRQLTFSELIPALCELGKAHREELLRLLAAAASGEESES